jgi:hypothetical protein
MHDMANRRAGPPRSGTRASSIAIEFNIQISKQTRSQTMVLRHKHTRMRDIYIAIVTDTIFTGVTGQSSRVGTLEIFTDPARGAKTRISTAWSEAACASIGPGGARWNPCTRT